MSWTEHKLSGFHFATDLCYSAVFISMESTFEDVLHGFKKEVNHWVKPKLFLAYSNWSFSGKISQLMKKEYQTHGNDLC